MYELYVKQKIEKGLKAVDEGRVLSSEDAKRRILGNECVIEPALENLEAINENNQWAALITVYRPNPERWLNWKERKI